MKNHYFRRLIIFIAYIFLLTLNGCNIIKLDSFYAADPIIIDGNYADWEKIPVIYFEDQNVLLAVCNDTDNLYMAFRFRDPKWLMAICQTGLTVWLDSTGKKEEQFGVKYSGGPKPQKNMDFERMRKNMPSGDRMSENRNIDSTKLFFVLNSDWWYKEQNISADGTFGPSVKYGFEYDMYTYEFAVPLDKIGENFYGMNTKLGNTISIGLEFGDIGMKRGGGGMGRGGGRGGDMPGGGGGMMPPGGGGAMPGMSGGGGGMRPGGMGGREGAGGTMPEKQKIWIKTKLAVAE